MSHSTPDLLWINVNPAFQRLERSLLQTLAPHRRVLHWAYSQTLDEPSSLDVALSLLHDYIDQQEAVHLAGHGTGGLLGLLYARRFPNRIKSLTLLSVGINPAMDWKALYYQARAQLPYSQARILAQMVEVLFGPLPRCTAAKWLKGLERDLDAALSPHSLLQRWEPYPEGVPVPLMVCGGAADTLVSPAQIHGWSPWLKDGDRLWLCPGGRHFFPATHPEATAQEMLKFWRSLELALPPAPHNPIDAIPTLS